MVDSKNYLDPSRELAVSLNVSFDVVFLNDMRKLQFKAQQIYPEQRNYDIKPHLAVVTKFMTENEVTSFLDCAKKELHDYHRFILSFSSIRRADQGPYVFLCLGDDSKQNLLNMRQRILVKSKGIGFETPHNEPVVYAYDPHLSIIKVRSSAEAAEIETILVGQFKQFKCEITKLYISKETRRPDGYADFPTVAEFPLT